MDPLMQAAHAFMGDLEATLAQGSSTVRLMCTPSERSSMLKSLRLMEWQPESRWPMVVFDDQPTVTAVRARLEEDYAALAKGLGEDGIRVEPLSEPPPPQDVDALQGARPLYGDDELQRALATASLARTLVAAAERVVGGAGAYIDGLCVVLLPPANHGSSEGESRRYQQLVAHLKLTVDADPRVRLLAYDPSGCLEAAVPAGVPFSVDEDALRAYLEEATKEAHEATADRPVPGVKGTDQGQGARLSPEQRQEVEAALGRKLPSDDVAASLRSTMFEAGKLLAEGRFADGAMRLRAARILCRLSALPSEEVVLLLATGSAFLSAEEPDRALHAFELAHRVADDNGLGADMKVHALLGVGGVHLMARAWSQADAAYAQALDGMAQAEAASAADDAPRATPPALAIELWRLRAHCATEMGEFAVAEAHAKQALDVAEAQLPSGEDLAQTTAPLLVEQLTPQLEAAGRSSVAQALRDHLARLASAPTLGGAKPSGEEVSP